MRFLVALLSTTLALGGALSTAAFASPATKPLILGHRGASGHMPEHTRASYELAYMDLVDTQNGNTVVTLGNQQALTIYWPMPADADEDGAFYLVHYTGMDRESASDTGDLPSGNTFT